mmetsp:Transcript_32206/g.75735  ORF Transcript_32206/g.75735 Transcript_32206/m.75735 type:complete len:89 (-) Transcript_32206:115-381(-)
MAVSGVLTKTMSRTINDAGALARARRKFFQEVKFQAPVAKSNALSSWVVTIPPKSTWRQLLHDRLDESDKGKGISTMFFLALWRLFCW